MYEIMYYSVYAPSLATFPQHFHFRLGRKWKRGDGMVWYGGDGGRLRFSIGGVHHHKHSIYLIPTTNKFTLRCGSKRDFWMKEIK